MNRKAFWQLLKGYFNNTCTDEERKIVDQWYELLDNGNPPLPDVEMDEIEKKLWNNILISAIEKNTAKAPVIKKNIWWKYAIAACLVGSMMLIGFIVIKNQDKITLNESTIIAKVNEGFLEEINKSDTAKNIKMEDGSILTIYPGSKLAFPKHFAINRREVYLDGDAFFRISKNPNRPFFVYSDQIVTQVLGTSFGIHKSDGKVEVEVKTGRVAVYEDKEHIAALNENEQKSNGVIITPNQKVTYYQRERHFVTSIVDQPKPVPEEQDRRPEQTLFYYKGTPLYKVLDDLENTYELQIILENEKIKNCLFTGDLTGQDLFTKLESICLVFNASYEIKGTKILLRGGKNCY